MKFERVFGSSPIEFVARSAVVRNEDGSVHTELKDNLFPEFWSQDAVDIVATKYFRKAGVPDQTVRIGEDGVPEWLQCSAAADGATFSRETDLRQVVHRLAGCWTYHGWKAGYFDSEEDARVFYEEISNCIIHQRFAPNSPQWFNTGLNWAYGIDKTARNTFRYNPVTQQVEEIGTFYKHPMVSACYILSLEDNLTEKDGIIDTLAKEAVIFKGGSGSGKNLSNLRGKNEPLSGGGRSSGMMSFSRVDDRSAGSIKSGGVCLAPHQPVFTAGGVKTVKELADSGADFIALTYDRQAGRVKMRIARAFKAGQKEVWKLTTDKGEFHLSHDHPVLLKTGECVPVNQLKIGMSLFASHTNRIKGGYVRVGLHDGKKGKEVIHRLVMKDIIGYEPKSNEDVHHKDENTQNNLPNNLEIKTNPDHASHHSKKMVAEGTHIFLREKFPKEGSTNGMAHGSEFWNDQERVASYSKKQGDILRNSGRSRKMQREAVRQKILNIGYRIINAGYPIDTFDEYYESRKAVIGPVGCSKVEFMNRFNRNFGSFENMVAEIKKNNHRVTGLEVLGFMDVYDVEVDSDEPDDKRQWSQHNFAIPSVGVSSPYCSMIHVLNTRRAAMLKRLNLDHPDIEEYIKWKPKEEQKVVALIAGSKLLERHMNKILRTCSLDGGANPKKNKALRRAIIEARNAEIPENYLERALLLAKQGHTQIDIPVLTSAWGSEAYETVSGQNANNSVGVPDRFMQFVEQNRDWEMFWRTELKKAQAENREPHPCGAIPAAKLWNDIAEATWHSGDPGAQFSDRMNQWHTCPQGGLIRASNPCLRRGTRLLTRQGWRKVEDLLGKSVEIFDGIGWAHGEVWYTGVKPLVRVHLNNGRSVDLTPDHQIYTEKGWLEAVNTTDSYVPQVIPSVNIETENQLKKCITGGSGHFHSHPSQPMMESLGFLQGDGTVRADIGVTVVNFTPEKDKEFVESTVLPLLSDIAADKNEIYVPTLSPERDNRYVFSRKKLSQWLENNGFDIRPLPERRLMGLVWQVTEQAQGAFLRGLFGANGNVLCDSRNAVVLVSTCREMLQEVQLLLLTMGINSSVRIHNKEQEVEWDNGVFMSRESYHLEITHNQDINLFAVKIGFPQKVQQKKLSLIATTERQCSNSSSGNYRNRLHVTKVEDLQTSDDVYDFRSPNTHAGFANGLIVHNCGEYLWIDDSSCNLGSINVVRFYNPKINTFDVQRYQYLARLATTALDISVEMGQFPSEKVAYNTYAYRTLGLGYANIGALLMQMGLPYDSDAGRNTIAGLTAILTFAAYHASAELARDLCPFMEYETNKEDMLRVLRNHVRAAITHEGYEGLTVPPAALNLELCPAELAKALRPLADQMYALGQQHGYRNAQVSVCAPTGTIGFAMDCDTLSIEPDFQLVKYKTLAGGGRMKIVNSSVCHALCQLGYTAAQIDGISRYVFGHKCINSHLKIVTALLRIATVDAEFQARLQGALNTSTELKYALSRKTITDATLEKLGVNPESKQLLADLGITKEMYDEAENYCYGHETVEGAPHVKPEHYAVFDCADRPRRNGTRSIRPEAHVLMVAAAQPFFSGGLSKTVNMPYDGTIEDIKRIYKLAWETGCKSISVYRDRSKLTSPLSADSVLLDLGPDEEIKKKPKVKEAVRYETRKVPPPNPRRGRTQKTVVGGQKIFLTANEYPDGSLCELFISCSVNGTPLQTLMNVIGQIVSVSLQHGVPLQEITDKLLYASFEPSGLVRHDPQIKSAKSILDYVGRFLAIHYAGRKDLIQGEKLPLVLHRSEMIKDENYSYLPERGAPLPETDQEEDEEELLLVRNGSYTSYSGESCPTCGQIMIRNGSCLYCRTCKTSSGGCG